MLLSDTHMGPTIRTSTPLDNPSIFHLPPSTDYDTQYGGDSSLTLSGTSNQHAGGGNLDDGTDQSPHFPAEQVVPAGEPSSPHFPRLDVSLLEFASLLNSLHLPAQAHSLRVFLIDDADVASQINKAIQELRRPFREFAGVSNLSVRVGDIPSIAGLGEIR